MALCVLPTYPSSAVGRIDHIIFLNVSGLLLLWLTGLHGNSIIAGHCSGLVVVSQLGRVADARQYVQQRVFNLPQMADVVEPLLITTFTRELQLHQLSRVGAAPTPLTNPRTVVLRTHTRTDGPHSNIHHTHTD